MLRFLRYVYYTQGCIYKEQSLHFPEKTLVTTVKISWILEFGFPCMRRLTSEETLKRMFTVLG